MPENRRLSLSDLMVLIAALTPSLFLIRVGVGLNLFELKGLKESGGQSAPFARQLVEFLNVGGGCILAGLVPAVLILGLYKAKPSDALQGPGLIACLLAALAAIQPLIWFAGISVIESRNGHPSYSVHFNNVFGRWILAAGPMILGAWITLALLGRRPKPTWTDRVGCVLGACFAAFYLYSELYFVVMIVWRALSG
jgi:hypothetical protein